MELHDIGNGSAVNGRGLRHRKMTPREAVELAADIASGRPFVPARHHLADIFGVPMRSLSEAVKARAAAQEVPAEGPAKTPIEEVAVEDVPPDVSLVRAWHSATPHDREWFVRVVGVDAVWDVIARLIR